MVGAPRRLWIPAPETDSAAASLKRSRTCAMGCVGVCVFLYIEREWGFSQQEFGQSLALGQKAGKEAGSKTWHLRVEYQGTSSLLAPTAGCVTAPVSVRAKRVWILTSYSYTLLAGPLCPRLCCSAFPPKPFRILRESVFYEVLIG